jgi:predicted AlkP superfamily phosphohydrolase/phosphomutase
MDKKVLVIGLDCATPEIVFDRREELPVLRELIENGLYGNLRSSDPPITIPAWMVMCTGKDPGKLGLYGFRHRKDYTYPTDLRIELEEKFGPYIFDVVFRTDDKDKLLEQTYDMTEQRFKVLNHLITKKPWDFFMFVEIGVDRIHHAFWKYLDPVHHLYEKGNPYENVILDYYKRVDTLIGELLSNVDQDTTVLVVSDHGAKSMKGAFCINEWLIEQGDLVVNERHQSPISFEKVDVDWSRTKAWGWGGYYARIFLNVEGRETQGVIKIEDYKKEREALIERLAAVKGPNEEEWKTKIIKPQKYFQDLNGDYPDLMIYFDDLYWRSAGTLGHGTKYLLENDTGPDDAVHAQDGIYILYDPKNKCSVRKDANILDIGPTILDEMGLAVPEDMRGNIITKA